jgi:hypothetical protein
VDQKLPSWDRALNEAVDLQLLKKVEFAAAGISFHSSANIDIAALTSRGFNRTTKPQQ